MEVEVGEVVDSVVRAVAVQAVAGLEAGEAVVAAAVAKSIREELRRLGCKSSAEQGRFRRVHFRSEQAGTSLSANQAVEESYRSVDCCSGTGIANL